MGIGKREATKEIADVRGEVRKEGLQSAELKVNYGKLNCTKLNRRLWIQLYNTIKKPHKVLANPNTISLCHH